MKVKPGDKLRIIYMKGEPQYIGKEGYVRVIDDAKQIHGSWGACAIIPSVDKYEVISEDKNQ